MSVVDWITVVGLVVIILGAVASYAVMLVTCWWMKHNVPELWAKSEDLDKRLHAVEKRMTKEFAIRNKEGETDG